MASTDQENCRICAEILSKKQRRQIFSDAFKVFGQLVEVLGYVPTNADGLSKCICFRCFNRINKISKIDFDLNNRVDQLKVEKRNIICELRKNISKPNQPLVPVPSDRPSQTFHCVTSMVQNSLPSETQHEICIKRTYKQSPAKFKGKRHIKHTPTPRKKKVLKTSPAKTVSFEIPKAKRRLNIAEKLLSPFKAKVQVRSATEKLRTRIVKEKGLYAVLVGIVRGQRPSVIAKRFCNVPQMQEHIVNNILKLINAECINMCKVKVSKGMKNNKQNKLH